MGSREVHPRTTGLASAHPFVQQGRSVRRKIAILAIVIGVQVVIVSLYLYFTGSVTLPYMLVPVTIIPAPVH